MDGGGGDLFSQAARFSRETFLICLAQERASGERFSWMHSFWENNIRSQGTAA